MVLCVFYVDTFQNITHSKIEVAFFSFDFSAIIGYCIAIYVTTLQIALMRSWYLFFLHNTGDIVAFLNPTDKEISKHTRY